MNTADAELSEGYKSYVRVRRPLAKVICLEKLTPPSQFNSHKPQVSYRGANPSR